MADLYVMPSVSEPFGIAPLDMLDRDVIGYGLTALRTAAGLRQQDLVISADLSPATLRSLELGISRRLNRPATRTSTPGLFSTRTERVWTLMGRLQSG